MNMKKLVLVVLIFLPGFAVAAGGETPIPLDDMEPNLEDQASLQRGAKTYLNYCIGCHSLKYQRYQRTAVDLGIPADLMMEHMVFESSAQIGSLMDNAMSVDNAKQWFGSVPPDLTLYTMLKGGPEYLYTYMRVFYEDKTRPLGVNNLLYENVAMPHPLVELQGLQRKVCKQIPRVADNGG
ncbi:MAG: cytochrome c1, partial [Gammaproteobacteria bacterium]|nr:cytochrome c1 [Gammaproteobacteria bacterium]